MERGKGGTGERWKGKKIWVGNAKTAREGARGVGRRRGGEKREERREEGRGKREEGREKGEGRREKGEEREKGE